MQFVYNQIEILIRVFVCILHQFTCFSLKQIPYFLFVFLNFYLMALAVMIFSFSVIMKVQHIERTYSTLHETKLRFTCSVLGKYMLKHGDSFKQTHKSKSFDSFGCFKKIKLYLDVHGS